MDHVFEILNDWEMEDDYYYDYLRDQGYQDEDGDIDWDAVEKNGDTWLGYNDEARMWFNKATSALEPSISSLTDIIADYTNNWSEHPTIENYLDSNNYVVSNPKYDEKSIGSHAMAIVGYDLEMKHVIAKNFFI